MAGTQAGTEPTAEADAVLYAAKGAGPLFERSYSGTIVGSDLSPEALAELVRGRFVEFAPPETAAFQCEGRDGALLEVGDEMAIRLSGIVKCKVRVVHVDARSLTLRTLEGHPEAGRITFGAGRDGQGKLTFRICSRARAGGLLHYLGWLLMGRAMQGRCWIRFVRKVAEATGGRLAGPVRVRTERATEGPADCGACDLPTFCCDDGG